MSDVSEVMNNDGGDWVVELHCGCGRIVRMPLVPEKAKLEAEIADLRAACEQKQEIIDSFQAVDEARRDQVRRLEGWINWVCYYARPVASRADKAMGENHATD